MLKESDILKIVKEDMLRILGERKEKTPLGSIETGIKVFSSFVSEAIKCLKEEGLIRVEEKFVKLTQIGRDKAKDILRKHLILENYFKKTSNEKIAHRKAHILEHYISEEVIKNIKKICTLKEKGISLTKLKLHKESLIADITTPNSELFERMVSMGIFPGEEINITNKISNGVVVKIKNKKFALGKDIAKEIKVIK
ncbi:FeoA domain-containing protein [Candidatus Aerophobetes bacterium]|nr:FeoA domain-containing protein [Candidatus Aerophobetes bacterium]